MRTRAAVASVVASIGILAVGWQVGQATTAQTANPVSTGASAGTGTGGSTTTGSTTGSATPGASSAPSPAAAPASDGTWTGQSVQTRFGPVQVQVTISGGSITDVTALQLTDADGRSVQISNRAAPILRQEVLASQSANVSNVSGATYTSQAYLGSLQSALDQAGF